MAKNIYIVIVSYRNFRDVEVCLKSLEKINKKNLVLKTIIVDNSTRGFPADKLKKLFPAVWYLSNQKNIGFGAANNIGIRLALKNKADYILLLNPDTKADYDKDFLPKMTKFMESNPRVGAVGPCLVHPVLEKIYYDYGGYVNKKLARASHLNQVKKSKQKFFWRDFVSAACMLAKADVFQKVMFDERYFLYLEDVDFCMQLKQNEYKIANLSTAYVWHRGSTSVSEKEKILYSWKSSLLFSKKWTPFCYKPLSVVYNSLFYPYLAIIWSLKRLKRSWLKGR